MTPARRRVGLPAAGAALLLLPACATWRPLDRAQWERADAHADVFTTRLRVTRLDGARLYLEQPRWSAATLHGV